MSSISKKQQLIQGLNLQVRLMSAKSVLFSQTIADKVGIHSTDMECLDFLVLHGSSTAGQLAELTGLTTGAITAMIDRLEKRNFVKRKFDKNDRRKVLVVPDIKKVNEEIGKYTISMATTFDKHSNELSVTELETILKFLVKENEVATEEISKLKKE
jgi:predicted transcriptional regulator